MSEREKECPSCGLDVPADADVCPYCGYEFPERKGSTKAMAILFAVLLLGWALYEVLGLLVFA